MAGQIYVIRMNPCATLSRLGDEQHAQATDPRAKRATGNRLHGLLRKAPNAGVNVIQAGSDGYDEVARARLIGHPFAPVERQVAEIYLIQNHVVTPGIAVIVLLLGGSRPSFVLDALSFELYRDDLFCHNPVTFQKPGLPAPLLEQQSLRVRQNGQNTRQSSVEHDTKSPAAPPAYELRLTECRRQKELPHAPWNMRRELGNAACPARICSLPPVRTAMVTRRTGTTSRHRRRTTRKTTPRAGTVTRMPCFAAALNAGIVA